MHNKNIASAEYAFSNFGGPIDNAIFDYIRGICDNDLAVARTRYKRYKCIAEDKLEVNLDEKSEFMQLSQDNNNLFSNPLSINLINVET